MATPLFAGVGRQYETFRGARVWVWVESNDRFASRGKSVLVFVLHGQIVTRKQTKQTSHFCACVRKVRVLQSVMDNCERKFMKLKANTHTYTFMQSHKEHEKEQK